jgi:signal transduction histidine kinase
MRIAWLFLGFFLSLTAIPRSVAFADPVSRLSVLIINQSNSDRPWSAAIIKEIRSMMTARSDGSAAVYVEDLDLYRFNSPDYLQSSEQYFREKYRDKPIGVIISIGPAGLDSAVRIRDKVWPNTPIVFSAVDKKTSDLDLAPEVTGIVIRLTIADMIKAARSLLPDTERFALVGDRLEDQLYYGGFSGEMRSRSEDFQFIDLMGLPLDEVKQRVAALPEHTVILYIGINSEPGRVYVPAGVVSIIAATANSPVFVSVETYFGTGAIGGYILSPHQVGEEAGYLALRVLDGEKSSDIPVADSNGVRAIFDWRQLRRWHISESNVPLGSEIRYRDPGMWDQYRWHIIATLAIILIQSGMTIGLLIERYRRQAAEEESQRRISQVIHLNRTATAGALSASVAHELNQPLGAILNYAGTAELLLSEKYVDVPQLKEIIGDIRRDDQRASEIIKHLRGLLKQKSEIGVQVFDLNETVSLAISILGPEAVKRGVALDSVRPTAAFPVRADMVQVQQVILNLVANAMDAISDGAAYQRRVMVHAIPAGNFDVEVMVSDTGPGIPKEVLEHIFDTFYTTKAGGTGLGLSIARTIIENYGGRIWAENRYGGGATFRFTLPLAHVISEVS